MIKLKNDPLKIQIPVPEGTYNVILTIHADEDIEFTIYSQTMHVMEQDVKMNKGEVRDFELTVNVCNNSVLDKHSEHFNGVEINIACEGGVRATALVSPV